MGTIPRFILVFLFVSAFSATASADGPGTRPQANSPQSFTIQQALSAPFPTELVAAPAKDRFAWVFNAEGKRNIWVAEPSGARGGYAARPITAYADDDGQDIGELAWAPDAESIVYVRGGDLEFSDKPSPNPRSFAQGVEQDVWAVSLNGGEPRKLGEGHSPAVSPKGDSVAYIFKDQVWHARLDGSGKAEQLIHSNGESSSLRWSPDGSKLAFVSRRGDHSFIGVYDFSGQSLAYVDPSVGRDEQPVWSPDGRQIAFLRILYSKNALIFEPKRTGEPWSIRVADVATDKGREVWKSAEGKGSVFREVVADNQLFWGAGDRLIFPWERDGWTHLYAQPVRGGEAKLLTPGEFEVEYVALSPDRRTICFSSNQDDVDRRHVWQLPVDGDHPAALTRGSGIETAPVVASDNHTIAVLRSDARLPMRPAVVADGGELHDLAPSTIPAEFPAAQMVIPQQVIFAGADGMQIHGQIFLPAAAKDGARHPAVIFFHGGSRRQMLLGWHYMFYYSNAYAMNQFLASRGYVVLSVNYRSGIGYGLDFREALNYGAAGASEFNDVQGAGLYLRGRSDIDPKRIGLWGGSYGGYLTALGLARSSDLFAAGVDLHGVHDWNLEIERWVPSYDPGARQDFARLAWESSPMSAVKTWRSPVLLIQGDDDRNVPFAETVQLVEALRKQGVEFEQLIFPDEIHDFLLHRTWVAAYSGAADFLGRHLGATAATISSTH
ncbi:MAG: prolyl oligopeptidase family serine peptidase [Candidatus Acidiferrales bacterium]